MANIDEMNFYHSKYEGSVIEEFLDNATRATEESVQQTQESKQLYEELKDAKARGDFNGKDGDIGSVFFRSTQAPTKRSGSQYYTIVKSYVVTGDREVRMNVDYLLYDNKLYSFEMSSAYEYTLLYRSDMKGEKGDAFRYEDFTPAQIAQLQKPATDAAEKANEAATDAKKATANANGTAEYVRDQWAEQKKDVINGIEHLNELGNDYAKALEDMKEESAEALNAMDATFASKEATRQSTFEAKEATRDAANEAALNAAEKLSELEGKITEEIAESHTATISTQYPAIGDVGEVYRIGTSSTFFRREIAIPEGWDEVEVSVYTRNESASLSPATYVVLIDEDGIILDKAMSVITGSGSEYRTYRLPIPSNCKKMFVNSYTKKEATYTFVSHKDKIEKIQGEVADLKETQDDIVKVIDRASVDLTKYSATEKKYIDKTKWLSSSNYTGNLIPISNYVGRLVEIVGHESREVHFAFIQEQAVVSGQDVLFAEGYTRYLAVAANSTVVVEVPNDAAYLYIQRKYSSNDTTPSSVVIYSDIERLDYEAKDNDNEVKRILLQGSVISLMDSKDGLLPNNTYEQFMAIGKYVGKIKKADMVVTSDNRVFMNHDASNQNYGHNTDTSYYVRDANGNTIPEGEFVYGEHTLEECLALRVYDSTHNVYLKTCDLETYLRICRRNRVVPMLTLRDAKAEECMQEVSRLLKKYRMETSVIINCFPCSLDKVGLVRRYLPHTFIRVLGSSADKNFTLTDAKEYLTYGNILIYLWTTSETYEGRYDSIINWCNKYGNFWYANVTKADKDGSAIIPMTNGQHLPIKKTYYVGVKKEGSSVSITNATYCKFSGKDVTTLFSADVELSADGKSIYISHVRENAEYDLHDEIFDSWLIYFPCDISCDKAAASVDKANKRFVVSSETTLADGTYIVKIEI